MYPKQTAYFWCSSSLVHSEWATAQTRPFFSYLNANLRLLFPRASTNLQFTFFFQDEKVLCCPGKLVSTGYRHRKGPVAAVLCMHIRRIRSPRPTFSVLLFELNTGASSTRYSHKQLPKVMATTTTKWSYRYQRDTLADFRPLVILHCHYIVISITTHYINISVYFLCNINWLTHALIHLSMPCKCAYW